MEQALIERAQAYATQHQLRLAERLGFGIHGIIFRTESNMESRNIASAIKVHRFEDPYSRELSVYQELKHAGVAKILGFNVPQLLRHHDGLLILEMTVVTRPFVLDFAGAYLNMPPEFPDSVWADWEVEKKEQFGERWSEVLAILGALEELSIHMVDVSPSNIAFALETED
jgi:hypothetical protein